MDYVVEKVGGRKVLDVDYRDWEGNLSVGNPECFKSIMGIMKSEDFDEMYLTGEFRKIYPEEQVKILREVRSALDEVEENLRKLDEERDKDACVICIQLGKFSIKKALEKLESDPVKAYFMVLEKEWGGISKTHKCERHLLDYIDIINMIKKPLEKTTLIKEARKFGEEEVYHKIFHPSIIPSFITSKIEIEVPKGAKLIEKYMSGSTGVSIYELPGVTEKYYFVSAPELRLHEDENKIVNDILDKISKEESMVINPKEARRHFVKLGKKMLSRHKRLGEKRLKELSDIIARYSAGYGILEVLLNDHRLQDVYMDSPGDSPIYVYHGDHEECITNIIPNRFELEKLSARFRALSGRPFDESSPVLHAELEDLGVRVCGLCPPATFEGIGFAFRRHKPSPWTLPQFIEAGMMDVEVAGILSFLVDGQKSILITGPRSSGKTSLLSALLAETSPNMRIIIIEDTPELPVDSLREVGYKIQHIRTQPSFGSIVESGYELTAEEALRTALRLGESVLVLGEVRGPEARALFEAMRIGAAGNVVMGTVHGSSPYDTWDRIVNDLGVPSTSFKATDVVISLASLKRSGEIRRYRKILNVVEVGKYWREDPYHEKGFSDITVYDPKHDKWKIIKDLEKSEMIRQIAKMKNMSMSDVRKNIRIRTKIQKMLIDYSKKYKRPDLLEIKTVARCNIETLKSFAKRTKRGKVDQNAVLKDVKTWLDSYVKS